MAATSEASEVARTGSAVLGEIFGEGASRILLDLHFGQRGKRLFPGLCLQRGLDQAAIDCGCLSNRGGIRRGQDAGGTGERNKNSGSHGNIACLAKNRTHYWQFLSGEPTWRRLCLHRARSPMACTGSAGCSPSACLSPWPNCHAEPPSLQGRVPLVVAVQQSQLTACGNPMSRSPFAISSSMIHRSLS